MDVQLLITHTSFNALWHQRGSASSGVKYPDWNFLQQLSCNDGWTAYSSTSDFKKGKCCAFGITWGAKHLVHKKLVKILQIFVLFFVEKYFIEIFYYFLGDQMGCGWLGPSHTPGTAAGHNHLVSWTSSSPSTASSPSNRKIPIRNYEAPSW